MIAEMIKERNLPPFRSREEMIDLLMKNEYGYFPNIPYEITVSDPVNVETRYCDRRVAYSRVNMTVTTQFGSHTFPIRRILHTDGTVNPFFVLLAFDNNVPNRSYPTEEVADNDFDVLTINYQEVTSDSADFTNGLPAIFMPEGRKSPTDCGKLMYWAWAACRVLDYAMTLPCLDHKQAAVIGHSRLGKTALLAGMLDERFRYVFANGSGGSGAALSRGNSGLPFAKTLHTTGDLYDYEPEWGTGETIRDVLKQFPFWFCENYQKYAIDCIGTDFDQHYLLATIAPRYVYVGSGNSDLWADPTSEFLSTVAVSEYYEKLGLPGLTHKDRLPEPEEPYHEGMVGYHMRKGPHFLSRHDWQKYMAYIRKHQFD